MPDPTAHADDMKSLAVIEPNASPAFWWVNPWGYALSMKRALHAVHELAEITERHNRYHAAAYRKEEALCIKHMERIAEQTQDINFHLETIKLREGTIQQLKTDLNTFQRQVEVTLKPACPHLYEDTIGYVHWAADEIKALKASLSVMTEDRDAYIDKLDRERGTHEATLGYVRQLEERVNNLEAKWPRDLWHGGKIYGDVYTCQPHSKTHNEIAKAKRKPAKKKAKAAPLVDIKTSADSFTYGNHEDRHSPAREAYSAIGRRFLKHLALRQAHAKAIAKAKKKGGRK